LKISAAAAGLRVIDKKSMYLYRLNWRWTVNEISQSLHSTTESSNPFLSPPVPNQSVVRHFDFHMKVEKLPGVLSYHSILLAIVRVFQGIHILENLMKTQVQGAATAGAMNTTSTAENLFFLLAKSP
jgi:hypothetical protein